MASLILNFLKTSSTLSNLNYAPFYNVVRYAWKMSTTRKRAKERNHRKMVKRDLPYRERRGTIKHRNLIASSFESLASRGFLRSFKPYTPEANVNKKVKDICKTVLGSNFNSTEHLKREEKFALLNECFKEFNHNIPNSILARVVNVNDVISFYETAVTTTVPFDELLQKDLPPNLYIQKDYIRFHPETDLLFKGVTAFPKSSTIVTGLKSKLKYRGFKADPPDNYYNTAQYDKTDTFE